MPNIKFDPVVQDAWDQLQADPAASSLLDRLNDILDVLEADPTDPRVRRRWFADPPLWCVEVVHDGVSWAILWEPDDEGTSVVIHVGPIPF